MSEPGGGGTGEARSFVLGTAGHIDHGKTALVRALTGVDTDRLQEEKARGITIELGFAELERAGRPHFAVVDVPGHEAFVRAMVAGAAGMDVVLLVVAADEGVMPQTREHLAIAELLAVPELVVALTKCDLVEPEWMELVEADVREALAGTPYARAPLVATSSVRASGLDTLLDGVYAAAERVSSRARDDLTRLPLDRVFTIQGTGTVVTGTMWSGSIAPGAKVRLLPEEVQARVRGVQVHGRAVDEARAGDRTAVALSGEGADRDVVARGATLVTAPEWEPSRMLTVRVRLLPSSEWILEHNQRIHVHLGTADVLARVALLEDDEIVPGQSGWVQLRLEEPLVARARDRLVVRAYSPVTTIGGGVVAEPQPPKRNRLHEETGNRLDAVLIGSEVEAVAAVLEIAEWGGVEVEALPILTGLTPALCAAALAECVAGGALPAGRRAFSDAIRREAEGLVGATVATVHGEDPLRPAVPAARARAAVPSWASPLLADAVLGAMVASGALEPLEGGFRAPGHRPTPTAEQEEASHELDRLFADAGLAAPTVEELPPHLRERNDLWSLVRRLEEAGAVCQVTDGLYVSAAALDDAADRVRSMLGGRRGLGPADFREALPVTRKHLIPLLNYLDGRGTTQRSEAGRDVPAENG